MRYVTITTWELLSGVDFELTMSQVKEKRLPALHELGADRVQVIRTSDRTIAAITEWPDQRTRDDAELLIEQIRKKVRSEDHSRMTGELKGMLVAEI